MKDTRKGFTLVELLAVIVILAIIMIIAIPSVLGTMQTAQEKSFREYITNVYEKGEKQYLTLQTTNSLSTLSTCDSSTITATTGCKSGSYYVFNITTALGLSSTGDYKGYVAILPGTSSSTSGTTDIYVYLYNGQYTTTNFVKVAGTSATRPDDVNLSTTGASTDAVLSTIISSTGLSL